MNSDHSRVDLLPEHDDDEFLDNSHPRVRDAYQDADTVPPGS